MPDLPQTLEDWRQRMGGATYTIHSALANVDIKSGSQIEKPQFYALRALYIHDEASNPTSLVRNKRQRCLWLPQQDGEDPIEKAERYLEGRVDWHAYLDSLDESNEYLWESGCHGLGHFKYARQYQMRIEQGTVAEIEAPKITFSQPEALSSTSTLSLMSHSPTPPFGYDKPGSPMAIDTSVSSTSPPEDQQVSQAHSETPSSDRTSPTGQSQVSDAWSDEELREARVDESVVNMAHLLFQDGVMGDHPVVRYNWTIERMPFTVTKLGGSKVFTARVDGALRRWPSHQVLAIIEVKPYDRDDSKKKVNIRMQETAQIAGWIAQHPPSDAALRRAQELKDKGEKDMLFSRLLISQDRLKVYLTFATFDADYVKYICDKETTSSHSNPSFLKMHEFGPFKMEERSHVKNLAAFMVAYNTWMCTTEGALDHIMSRKYR